MNSFKFLNIKLSHHALYATVHWYHNDEKSCYAAVILSMSSLKNTWIHEFFT